MIQVTLPLRTGSLHETTAVRRQLSVSCCESMQEWHACSTACPTSAKNPSKTSAGGWELAWRSSLKRML